MLNLVLNARDATTGNGIVSISARGIAPAIAAGVELRVADDGIGMSRATLARIFDPCFTTGADGLGGMGLPMVELFVRGAGGALSIESALGVGTTVILTLPAIEIDPSAQTHVTPEEQDL